jgi:hypothetical protein
MIELEWVVNEKTGEKHLYYRELPGKPQRSVGNEYLLRLWKNPFTMTS